MFFPRSAFEWVFGSEPKTYRLSCLDCDYSEHLLLSESHEEEPYRKGHIGMRVVKRLPEKCPECGGDRLRKVGGPPLCR